MKKVFGIILALSLMLTMVLTSVGCSPVSGNGADKSPTPSATQVPYSGMVEDFIKNSSTYKFDGIEGSLKLTKVVGTPNGDGEFTIEYQTAHPGHGDRSGQVLAQVITNHTATIQVKEGKITSAICDESRDIFKDASGNQSEAGSGQELTMPVGQSPDLPPENLANK